MAIVDPGGQVKIPKDMKDLRIKNMDDDKKGSCNVFWDGGSQNVQLAPAETKTISLQKNPGTLDNTGKTELDVTWS